MWDRKWEGKGGWNKVESNAARVRLGAAVVSMDHGGVGMHACIVLAMRLSRRPAGGQAMHWLSMHVDVGAILYARTQRDNLPCSVCSQTVCGCMI